MILDDLSAILVGIPFTIALTLAAFMIGAVLGLPLCAMRLSKVGALRLLATALILTFRSIPPIVWLFFIFFGVGLGYLQLDPFSSAAVGLGLITAANMAEIYRGALSAIHPGQWEAATVLSLSRRHQFVDVVGPQLLRIALPSATTYAIGLLQDSAVSSAIGVHEIAFQAYHVSQETFRGLDVYAAAAVLYILISLPIAWFARWTDVRLRARVAPMSDLLAFWGDWLPTLLDGFGLSLQVTAVCLLLGIPLGLVLALGVQSTSAWARWIALILVEIGRGTPALILLQFAYFGLPTAGLTLSSFTSAALALAWCTGAYTSEIIRAGMEAVPFGQQEAATAIGLGRIDALRYVILPQGLRVAIPALLGFSILMLQSTSLCFTIALPELVSQAYIVGSNTFRYMPIFLLAGLLFASVCIPATICVSLLERRLGRHAA